MRPPFVVIQMGKPDLIGIVAGLVAVAFLRRR